MEESLNESNELNYEQLSNVTGGKKHHQKKYFHEIKRVRIRQHLHLYLLPGKETPDYDVPLFSRPCVEKGTLGYAIGTGDFSLKNNGFISGNAYCIFDNGAEGWENAKYFDIL